MKFAALAAVVLLLAACAPVDTDAAYAEALKKFANQIDQNSRDVARANRIMRKLASAAAEDYPETMKWNWELHVFRAPADVAAYTFPHGKIILSSGLFFWGKFNDDEMAFVIGHEVSHSLLGHHQIILETYGNRAMYPTAHVYAENTKLELQADRLAMVLSIRASYDARAAISVLQKAKDIWSDKPPAGLTATWDERIQQARGLLAAN